MRTALLALSVLAFATPALSQEAPSEYRENPTLSEEPAREGIEIDLSRRWTLSGDDLAFVYRNGDLELELGHEEIERAFQLQHVGRYEDDFYGAILRWRW